MDIQNFETTTLTMPGLRQVFAGEAREGYIYITGEQVHRWGVEEFNFAITRLSEIVQKVLGVKLYIIAPLERGGYYTLCVMNPNYQK